MRLLARRSGIPSRRVSPLHVAALLGAGLACGRAASQDNIALGAVAKQSSDFSPAFGADKAVDGDFGNFTATASADAVATWEVDLGATAEIGRIVVHNRGDGCCQSRLRDIVVSVHDVSFLEDGPRFELEKGDPVWESSTWESPLLNPENELGGGGEGGPPELESILPEKVSGRFVRVTRFPDPDLSGTGGAGNVDEPNVMSLGEVEVFGSVVVKCPDAGDTHCTGLDIQGPVDNTPGIYSVSVNASDESGDSILYTFTADSGAGEPIVIGPTKEPLAEFDLRIGSWTISATADDDRFCPDAAPDGTCSQKIEIIGPDSKNLALLRPSRQSSDYVAVLGADKGNDGEYGNFTATAGADAAPFWEVDLLEAAAITYIEVFNRGDGCCQSRLRDITVRILDSSGEDADVVFESELLNPENVLGGGGLGGPPSLALDIIELAGAAVTGQVVRISRTPDPDLSGTGGQGNADEPNVLSIGEVEVYDTACPAKSNATCTELLVEGPPDGGPGLYFATASAEGDPIFYTFRATNGVDPEIVVGPQDTNTASFTLEAANWSISVTVGDSRRCPGEAENATCTTKVVVEDCPADADTHCASLTVAGPVTGNFPGTYTATAEATDDSGDIVLYTFTADNGVDPALSAGPQEINSATFRLGAGSWTITVRVGDSPFCPPEDVPDAACTENVVVENVGRGRNVALDGTATQSSDYVAALGAAAANDGNFVNFTATGPQDPMPTWEVDLGAVFPINAIAVHNRGDGCCQSRLRDITVAILDESGAVLFESELLNEENVLGGGTTDGPALLPIDVEEENGGTVAGRTVRVTRLPDPDLSGTGGQGNADEANVMSLGEVEVFAEVDEGASFVRGNADAQGGINITDGVFVLNFLFQGGGDPPCKDAADADDSGGINITDGVYILNFLFQGGPDPAAPYPDCGGDPSGDADGVDCAASQPGCV